MADFRIHGLALSPYVRAARMGAAEKGLQAELIGIDEGGLKGPDHLALHPFGRMPVLEHGDFRLYETQAILRYVDRIGTGPSLTPADPRLEARMNQLCGILDAYFFPNACVGIAFNRLVAPLFGIPVDETKIAASIPKAEIALAELARLLGDQAYLAGPDLSLADIMIAPQVSFLNTAPEGKPLVAAQPKLAAWLDRMAARPSMQATQQ